VLLWVQEEPVFMAQLYAQRKMVTLRDMKALFAMIDITDLVVPGTAPVAAPNKHTSALRLRVHSLLPDDALLLLDIHGAPLVAAHSQVPIDELTMHVEPFRVALLLSGFFLGLSSDEKDELRRHWRELTSMRRTVAGQRIWKRRPEWALRDPRHKNKAVLEYCDALSMPNAIAAACLQWNIKLLEQQGHPQDAAIPLSLAQQLQLAPVARSKQDTFYFAFLDDDDSGDRQRTLLAEWRQKHPAASQLLQQQQQQQQQQQWWRVATTWSSASNIQCHRYRSVHRPAHLAIASVASGIHSRLASCLCVRSINARQRHCIVD
jgi:hypothetical protein